MWVFLAENKQTNKQHHSIKLEQVTTLSDCDETRKKLEYLATKQIVDNKTDISQRIYCLIIINKYFSQRFLQPFFLAKLQLFDESHSSAFLVLVPAP